MDLDFGDCAGPFRVVWHGKARQGGREGKSPLEIAQAMKIKSRTVKTHRERLYKTLNIHDKMSLMRHLLVAVLRVRDQR